MAVDTKAKRSSAMHIGCPWRTNLPFPSGAISSASRLSLLYLYGFPRFVTLDCEAGSYAWTGADVGLLATRFIIAEPGSYLWTGANVDLLATRFIIVEPGSYSWTGVDASLLATRFIVAEPGSYAWTGVDVGLLATRFIIAEPGSYIWTGQDVLLSKLFILVCEQGVYLWTGEPVLLSAFYRGLDDFKYQKFDTQIGGTPGTVFEYAKISGESQRQAGGTDFTYKKLS